MSLWLEGTRGELAGTGVVAVGFNTEYHITMARETLPVMNPFDVGFWHITSFRCFATIRLLSGHSGHGWVSCCFGPVAFYPILTSADLANGQEMYRRSDAAD